MHYGDFGRANWMTNVTNMADFLLPRLGRRRLKDPKVRFSSILAPPPVDNPRQAVCSKRIRRSPDPIHSAAFRHRLLGDRNPTGASVWRSAHVGERAKLCPSADHHP